MVSYFVYVYMLIVILNALLKSFIACPRQTAYAKEQLQEHCVYFLLIE